MPKDKLGRNYTVRSKKGKDGKMHKYPHYGGSKGGGGAKKKAAPKKKKGGGGGAGKLAPLAPNGRRYSAVVIYVGGGVGLSIHADSGQWGAEYSRMIIDKALELAGKLDLDELDILKVLIALRLAAGERVKRIPIIGAPISVVGQEWRNFLAEFNLRP